MTIPRMDLNIFSNGQDMNGFVMSTSHSMTMQVEMLGVCNAEFIFVTQMESEGDAIGKAYGFPGGTMGQLR